MAYFQGLCQTSGVCTLHPNKIPNMTIKMKTGGPPFFQFSIILGVSSIHCTGLLIKHLRGAWCKSCGTFSGGDPFHPPEAEKAPLRDPSGLFRRTGPRHLRTPREGEGFGTAEAVAAGTSGEGPSFPPPFFWTPVVYARWFGIRIGGP